MLRELQRLLRLPFRFWEILALTVLPAFVAYGVYRLNERRITEVIGISVAIALFAIFVPRPGAALVALIIFLPLQGFGFGLLLSVHVPATFLREASYFKELMLICLFIAALRRFRDESEHIDAMDRALLAYVGVVTIYLFIPHVFATIAPSAWAPRFTAWRADCGYVIMFFAVRHAGIGARARERFVQSVLGLGWLLVAVGVYQKLSASSYKHFVIFHARQIQYLTTVLKEPIAAVNQGLLFITNPHPQELTSVFISPYDMADYLLLVVGITTARIVRDRRSPWNYVLLAGCITVLFFSRIRADSLGVLLILVVAVLPAPRRPIEARVRMILAIVIGAAVIVPSLGGTRFVGAQGGSTSNHGHIGEFEHGISVAISHPLGLGIGNQAATASKYTAEVGVPPNSLIQSGSVAQVSDELGIQALIPWLFLMVLIFRALLRRAREPDDLVTGAGLTMVGFFVAAQFHHALITYPGPWTLFAAVGLALAPRPEPEADRLPGAGRALVAR